MMSTASAIWTPQFWMHGWSYQSFLILPTPSEKAAPPGSAVTAKTWAKGRLNLETSTDLGKPDAVGLLIFPTAQGELKLRVKASVEEGIDVAKFEATGEVVDDVPAKGTVYELVGWAFRGKDDKVAAVRGSVMAVRGPDARPDIELGGQPIGTVGAFIITQSNATDEKPTPELMENLYVGSTGADVEKLQRKLKELGFYDGPIDGLFGQGVEQAVKEYEDSEGFAPDGVAGVFVLEALGFLKIERDPESEDSNTDNKSE